MRTPIDGARLSSGYGRRRHPTLGYNKMHRGVDFAAPRGTPIYAAGKGSIVYRGRNGAYGKYIRIRHNSDYATAYAHLRSFKRGVGKGARVRQGQVIGYVGSTGRSTGPHLHYEILRQGRRVNPMRIRLPSGRKLKGGELARFQDGRKETDAIFAALTEPSTIAQGGK
jgi:murein DD-endopeptidase MepM/ murein hydrolase activator NlpD